MGGGEGAGWGVTARSQKSEVRSQNILASGFRVGVAAVFRERPNRSLPHLGASGARGKPEYSDF